MRQRVGRAAEEEKWKKCIFCTLHFGQELIEKGKKWSVYGPISAARKTNPRFAKAVSLKLLVFRLSLPTLPELKRRVHGARECEARVCAEMSVQIDDSHSAWPQGALRSSD